MLGNKSRKKFVFVKRSRIDSPAADVFSYHMHPGSLDRLIPPWSFLRVIQESDHLKNESLAILELKFGPIKIRWISQHKGYVKNIQFQDEMTHGPLQKWVHTHSFSPDSNGECIMQDRIEYSIFPILNNLAFVNKRLQNYLNQFFEYRHELLKNDIKLFRQISQYKNKKVLVSGSNGVIGSALMPLLKTVGNHDITRLIRPSSLSSTSTASVLNNSKEIIWDPSIQKIDLEAMNGFDTIIHLGGSNILGRWTKSRKNAIRNSRLQSTKLICESILRLEKPPNTFICASAIGYYGNRGQEILTEESAAGRGFLSDLCKDWEGLSEPLVSKGIRVVHLRFGLVLTPQGGLLNKLMMPSLLRMGLKIKCENPFLSWISIEDAIRIILFAMSNYQITGPINVVSPKPVRMMEFVKAISNVFKIKFNLALNKNILKLVIGEALDEVILSSSFVLPKKIKSFGYQFVNTDLEQCLHSLLGR